MRGYFILILTITVISMTACQEHKTTVDATPIATPTQPKITLIPTPTATPVPTPSKTYAQTYKSSKSSEEDDYNAKNYNDAEEFYDDKYDDFDSYEDAEYYYNDHSED